MGHQRNDLNKLIVFIDSDAFVALAVETDASHKRAFSLLQALTTYPVKFVTSNYVFGESITIISIRKSRNAAIEYISNMHKPDNPFQIRRINEALEEEAIDIFKQQTSKNTSFVDCTNMAFMKSFHIDAIFSFDHVYKRNEFMTVEELIK